MSFFLCLGVARAENVIFHLRNGDRIAGTINSEDTNQVVISTTWTKSLAIPLAAIERREKAPKQSEKTATTKTDTKSEPASPTSKPAVSTRTNVVTAAKPAASTPTNIVAAAKPVPITAKPAVKPKPPKQWKADLKVGMDMTEGTKDRQLYYGRAKLTYEKPYSKYPKQFFRNVFDYYAEYGMTDGSLSANRMAGSSKTDFDLANHFFVYNLGGAGYDEIRKIELQYEIGPGIGYHLFTRTNFVLDTEIGVTYQVQERTDDTETRNSRLRLAEDITWKLGKKLTLTEKFEYYPNLEDFSQHRLRFECTLSYWLLQYLTLNLTALDAYDTQPARNVERNELLIRSSLGVIF